MKKMLVEYEELIRLLDTDTLYLEDSKMVRTFLNDFIFYMRSMMKENPQTDLLSVMGP